MSTELLIRRDADRVHYLASENEYGGGSRARLGRCDIAVIRWLPPSGVRDYFRVTLDVGSGSAFSFQDSLIPAEARRLALALNVAADEAEAAQQATEGSHE